jgi:hypothetical protein
MKKGSFRHSASLHVPGCLFFIDRLSSLMFLLCSKNNRLEAGPTFKVGEKNG